MQLSIIIVHYNVKYFLEQCLHSVTSAIKNIDAEIWVVDNASTDGFIDYIPAIFPQVKYIVNTTNVGFAKANNQALTKCSGKYILFLNPDTIVGENCFEKCIRFMEENKDAGALGVKMIDGSGEFLPESKRSFPGPFNSFCKLTGLSKLFPNSTIFARYSLAYLDENKNHEVDVLSGACMFCRKEIVTSLQGFDEAFFMYGEDIDLSCRIQKKGYKNIYFGESCIIHFKGESTKKNSIAYVKTFYNAMNIFVKKHYNSGGAILFSFLFHLAIWLRGTLSALFLLTAKINPKKTVKEKEKKGREFVLVGSPNTCTEMERILLKAGQTEIISITTNPVNNTEIINNIKLSGKTINNERVMVLCNDLLTWHNILLLVEKLKGTIALRFHAKGSKSIVGSDSKNVSGEAIGLL